MPPPRGASAPRGATEANDSGEVANQAAIARREGITRGCVTQALGLLRVAGEIQEHMLSLPHMVRWSATTERALWPMVQWENADEEKAEF